MFSLNEYPTRGTIETIIDEIEEDAYMRGGDYDNEQLEAILSAVRDGYKKRRAENIWKETRS